MLSFLKITVYKDADGAPLRMIGVNIDITERKASEQQRKLLWEARRALSETAEDLANRELALRESETRFRGTFENAAVGIGHVALDGFWLLVNQRLCDIVGYSRDELQGKISRNLHTPATSQPI